ncbi:Proteasome subunit beta type-4-like [Homarus americanus]|uniref:Proteasome subunit beta n=1 Tax=Homarus americanus TaxID=6706 RepID=A0A8J5K267_HOMAM|nr:Proteasome subunit beta type-4-like [Homarus americanus]
MYEALESGIFLFGLVGLLQGNSTTFLDIVNKMRPGLTPLYNGGVMLAADSLGSYGSLARFRDVKRLFRVTDKAALACSGDIADYQRDDECGGYTRELNAGALHCWLTRVLYNRRSRFDPLWLECVVAGYKDNEPFLGYVDKIGTAFEAKEVATGFGLHLAVPMIREAREKKPNLTRDDAQKLLKECLKVLYYRDCRAHFKYQLADITPEGVTIHDDINMKKETNWEVANYIK